MHFHKAANKESPLHLSQISRHLPSISVSHRRSADRHSQRRHLLTCRLPAATWPLARRHEAPAPAPPHLSPSVSRTVALGHSPLSVGGLRPLPEFQASSNHEPDPRLSFIEGARDVAVLEAMLESGTKQGAVVPVKTF